MTQAAEAGTLLTPKHDPNGPICFQSFRTILTQAMSGSLTTFISDGDYDINQYTDSAYKGDYFEVIPRQNSGFSVVGAIPSGSLPSPTPLDRLIIVSGSAQSWHCYAESSNQISARVKSGRLKLSGSL